MAYLDELIADPVGAAQRRRQAQQARSSPLASDLFTPQQQASVMSRVGSGVISGLSAVGNVLDLPGSSVRDLMVGDNPFDQWAPWNWMTSEHRNTGRDVLRQWGAIGPENNWGNWTGGLGFEVFTDPVTYGTLGAGALLKTAAGQTAKAAHLLPDIARGLSTAGRRVGQAEARTVGTLADALVASRTPLQGSLRSSQGLRLAKPISQMKDVVRQARGQGANLRDILDEPIGTFMGVHVPFYGSVDLGRLGAASGLGRNLGRGPVAQAAARGADVAWEGAKRLAPVRHFRQLFDSRVMDQHNQIAQNLAETFHERFGPAQAEAALNQYKASVKIDDVFKEFMQAYRPSFQMGGRTANEAALDTMTTFHDVLRHSMDTGRRAELDPIIQESAGVGAAMPTFYGPGGSDILDRLHAAGRTVRSIKDRGVQDVQAMGGNMTFMGTLEEGFLAQHYPRSVNQEYAKILGHRIVGTDNPSVLRHRDEATRHLPTYELNRMAQDPVLRQEIAARRGVQFLQGHSRYGQLLNPQDPAGHARELVDWVRTKGQARVYNPDVLDDMLRYQRGLQIYKNGLRAVHAHLLRHVQPPGGAGVSLRTAFEQANMNPDSALRYFGNMSGHKGASMAQLENLTVPLDVAESIKTVLRPTHFPDFMQESLNVVDRLNGLFKNSVTVLAPLGIPLFSSFFVRNVMSGQYNAMAHMSLDNLSDLGTYAKGFGDSLREIAEARKLQLETNSRPGNPLKITLAQAMDRMPEMVNMIVHGTLGHRIGFEDVAQAIRRGAAPQWPWSFRETTEEVLGKSGPMPSQALHAEIVRDHIARGVPRHEAVRRADAAVHKPLIEMLPGGRGMRFAFHHASLSGGKINQWAEYFNRAPLYHYYRRKGYTPERAAFEVKKRQFDYSDLSSFEKGVMKRVVPFYCVPDDTLALTRDGWKTCDEVGVGDDLLTYNVDDDCLEWQPCEEVAIFDCDQEICRWSNSRHSLRFTREHRWAVERHKMQDKNASGSIRRYPARREILRAYELNSNHSIIVTAPLRNDESILTPAQASLLGWLLTDGYYRWRGNHLEAVIYQTPHKFLDQAKAVAGWREGDTIGYSGHAGCKTVRVKQHLMTPIKHLLGRSKQEGRQNLWRVVTRLSTTALRALYDAIYMADGTTSKSRRQDSIAAESEDWQDLLQTLAFMLGMRAQPTSKGVYVSHRTRLKVAELKKEMIHYTGRVWCPRTKNSTWVMKQDGFVTISANTFSRKMTDLMFDTLTQRPGGALGQTIRATSRARETGVLTPEYVAETTAIPVSGPLENIFGTPPEGTDRYITGFGLGHEDPVSFLGYNPSSPVGGLARNFGLEFLSRTSPLIKGPLEWFTGQTFFQRGPSGGRPLEDLDPTINRTIANIGDLISGERTYRAPEYLSRGTEFLLANSPASRIFTSARTLSDPRKATSAKAWNLLTGLRLSDVSEAAQDAILKEKAQELMEETGALTFRRTYYTKEDLAQMPPEERQNALMLQLLMNWLADRGRQRKAQREQ